jgi:hypothetical protein
VSPKAAGKNGKNGRITLKTKVSATRAKAAPKKPASVKMKTSGRK